jgi:hypothetical protein
VVSKRLDTVETIVETSSVFRGYQSGYLPFLLLHVLLHVL